MPLALAAGIGLVVAHHQIAACAERGQQRHRHPRVVPPEDRYLPRARLARHHRGEAVDGDQDRRPAALPRPVESPVERLVIGVEQRAPAGLALVVVDPDIARHLRAVALLRDRGLVARGAVAVDHEPRISREYGGGVESLRQPARDLGRALVPGDVAVEVALDQTEPLEAARHQIAGVIAGQHDRACAIRILDRERGRFAVGQHAAGLVSLGGATLYSFARASQSGVRVSRPVWGVGLLPI